MGNAWTTYPTSIQSIVAIPTLLSPRWAINKLKKQLSFFCNF